MIEHYDIIEITGASHSAHHHVGFKYRVLKSETRLRIGLTAEIWFNTDHQAYRPELFTERYHGARFTDQKSGFLEESTVAGLYLDRTWTLDEKTVQGLRLERRLEAISGLEHEPSKS